MQVDQWTCSLSQVVFPGSLGERKFSMTAASGRNENCNGHLGEANLLYSLRLCDVQPSPRKVALGWKEQISQAIEAMSFFGIELKASRKTVTAKKCQLSEKSSES
jgi:hypothetical protein